jgi:trk system potassium uptake protein
MRHRRVARTLGAILRVFAAVQLVPLGASFLWDDEVAALGWAGPLKSTGLTYLLTAVFTFLLGTILSNWGVRKEDELREREAFFVVGFGWLLVAAIGALPFLITRATADPTVAFFESMSAITTTGFTALSYPLEQYPPSTHVWRATLHLFGGVGIVVVAVAVLARLTEGAVKLFGGESVESVNRIRPKLTQTAKSLFGIYMGLNTASFLGFLLTIHYTGERLGWKESAFHALVHAFSSLATGGMSTRTDSIGAFDSNWVSVTALVSLFIGGMSLPLLYRVLHGDWFIAWRYEEFRFYVAMCVLPSLLVAGFFLFNGYSVLFVLLNAPFAVISTLVTGGLQINNAQPFPDGVKLVLLLLMFTGAMVGSTTGAIKLHRILMLLRLVYYELNRLLHPHAISVLKMGGRIMPDESVRRIVVFFFTYVSVFIAGAIAFSLTGFDLETSVVAAAASLGAVGYGWGGILNGFGDPVGEAARIVSVVLMWMGRLEIFTAILIFVPATYRD